MKILIITGLYPPLKCGVGAYTQELAKSLNIKGNSVSVLSLFSSNTPSIISGIRLLKGLKKWNLLSLFIIVRLIKNYSPDVIHIQYPNDAFYKSFSYSLIPLIGFLFRKKIILTWHESFSLSSLFKFFILAIVPSQIIVVRPNYIKLLPFYKFLVFHKTFNFIPNASTIPAIRLSLSKKNIVRKKYISGQKRLIVYFGFIFPHKGVENLFKIANSETDQIIIVADFDPKIDYHRSIKSLIVRKWKGKVSIIDYMEAIDLGALLSSADAIVLPYKDGGGIWNTSIHAAVSSGSFLLTTSLIENGFNKNLNTYYAKVNDINEMKIALNKYAGTLNINKNVSASVSWNEISKQHLIVYNK